ncbi:hypothetical protein PybrP1_010194 [[Pythium] brassicae (nom. inval.)]|nr:hypothetical protein PybrP1_010194 [[Pythium] brassicae (nom. inval.)]
MAESCATATETMTQLATRALDIEHEEREHLEELRMLGVDHLGGPPPPPIVEGRVFERLYRYHLLPVQLQVLADAVAVYLVTPEVRTHVFATGRWRHPSAVGPCVRGQKLLDTVKKYVVDTQDDVSDVSHAAREIAEALVLSGFISPVHEPANEKNIVTYVHERDYYELVAPGAQQLLAAPPAEGGGGSGLIPHVAPLHQKKSVWAVTDGATRAGSVFRKRDAVSDKTRSVREFLATLSLCGSRNRRERKRYAVVNKTQHHALFLFASDCARQELSRVALEDALVRYEAGAARAPLHHGLKVWTDTNFEILDFVSKHRQEDWLLALLDAGAKYIEANPAHETWADANASFYSLVDATAAGDEFLFEALIGKVVLVVNVASNDPSAPVQFPELVALADKYAADGLCVLAFPCSQFGDGEQEFETDEEILRHVVQAYDVRFPVLTKRDVNGLRARPAFLFLNARLPGCFGPFTEWNFTKFLVDRNGQPYKRYDTHALPVAAIEADIRQLLGDGRHSGKASGARGSE